MRAIVSTGAAKHEGIPGQSQGSLRLFAGPGQSGADFALVLPPSYYGSLLTRMAILDFFRAVAAASPIPNTGTTGWLDVENCN